jgi:hypothetical protein
MEFNDNLFVIFFLVAFTHGNDLFFKTPVVGIFFLYGSYDFDVCIGFTALSANTLILVCGFGGLGGKTSIFGHIKTP